MTYSIGWQEMKLVPLLRCMLCECLGTMMLVTIGCGSALNWLTAFDITQVSLAFGLAVASIATVCGPISGGHLNPAVSLGLFAGASMPLLDCIMYIVSQCIGGVLGSTLLYVATPANYTAKLGANDPALGVSSGAAVIMEMVMTFLLVMVVFSTAVEDKTKVAPGLAPLIIGLTVTAAHLVLIPYTGTSINPARSLGPLVVGLKLQKHHKHWVFWVGPLLGGALAGLVHAFGIRPSLNPQAKEDFETKKVDSNQEQSGEKV